MRTVPPEAADIAKLHESLAGLARPAGRYCVGSNAAGEADEIRITATA